MLKTGKAILFVIPGTLVILCLLAFKPKVYNKIPLNKNQTISWCKEEINAKEFYFKASKLDCIEVVAYDIENNWRTQVVDTIFASKTKFSIKYSGLTKVKSNNFFLAIKVNGNYYFKHIEVY